jgi:serine/threonine-protein kinase
VDEAVRTLSAVRKFGEAAEFLLSFEKIELASVASSSAEKKKAALRAAVLLSRSEAPRSALEWFVALGEKTRAADLLRRLGDAQTAAILESEQAPEGPVVMAMATERLGRWGAAAKLYLSAGLLYDAARCFLEGAELSSAFDVLAKASRRDPRYRSTCVAAIRAAITAKAFDYRLDHFVGDFVASGPRDLAEAEALRSLAEVYEEQGFLDHAEETYRSIARFDPQFPGVQHRLDSLQQGAPSFLDDRRAREDAPPVPAPVSPPAAKASPKVRPDAVEVGSVIAGRYRLEQRIGSGGMAVVFRATDQELQMQVALKAFPSNDGPDPLKLERFRRELRMARSVLHPNVVRVFDMGVSHDIRYITMELLHGHDLKHLISEAQTPMDTLLDHLVQACAGLQATHDAGIVHRDIKPGNLFITDVGVLKVMDYGIARPMDAPEQITGGGVIVGSPHYMCPEQIRHTERTTPAADIYSLGVVAYLALTGMLPFNHAEAVPLLMMHVEQEPTPPRQWNPEIPEGLEAVILRCLAKSPAQRWPSAEALGAEFGRWARSLRDGV